jgi:hypothetical protein
MVKKYIFLFLAALTFFSCSNNNKTPAPPSEEIKPPVIEKDNPYAVVDKSPLDISYYPVNYPAQIMDKNDSAALVTRVIYSRPHKMGRVIFSNDGPPKSIQQYGAYWRLGANEATEIEFFKPVIIGNQKINKGRYIIYCIPSKDKWTIVINTNLYSFGLHQDTAKNILKTDIPVETTAEDIEYFTMVFQKSLTGADLLMAWGNLKAVLPIRF